MRVQSSSSTRFVEPMLSLAVSELPEGQEWAYEVKFNGYRAQGVKTAGRVQLRSRYGANFNERFPSIARALSKRFRTRRSSMARSSPTTPMAIRHSTSCKTDSAKSRASISSRSTACSFEAWT